MEAFGVFGLCGFVISILAMSRVRQLERILRENGIRPVGAGSLSSQLRARVGQTLNIEQDMGAGDGSTIHHCKLLDVDEDWALILADEGKKKEREMLIRLDSVKQVKP